MNKKRQLNVWKTIIASLWTYFIVSFIFGGAIIYAVEKLGSATYITEICFWGLVAIFITIKFCDMLTSATFFVYEDDASSEVSE